MRFSGEGCTYIHHACARTCTFFLFSFNVSYIQMHPSIASSFLAHYKSPHAFSSTYPPGATHSLIHSTHSASTIRNMAKNPSVSFASSVTVGFCGSPADRRRWSCFLTRRLRSAAMGSASSSSPEDSPSEENGDEDCRSARSDSLRPKSLLRKVLAPGAGVALVPSAAIFCRVLS